MVLFRRQFTPQGAPPGTVTTGPAGVEPRITLLSFNQDEIEERSYASIDELPELRSPGRLSWVDVSGLGDGSVVQALGERLGLHALAISDVINLGQRPKVDQYDDMHFAVVRMVTLDAQQALTWEQVSIFMGEGLVLTFQETHDDCLDPLRRRIRAGRKSIRSSGADYLACMVIDAIVDGYFPILEHFGAQLEQFEDEILLERSKHVLGRLYSVKRDLARFRRATWPLREALAQLERTDDTLLDETTRLHLRDTLDHTMQVVDVNESFRELAASLIDVHLSMVGQRTNEIMRVLTVVSAIFIPLTFVAGIYGMNFDTGQAWNLPELRWPLGYVFFWGVCLVMASTLLFVFRRLGWLGGGDSEAAEL